MIKSLVNSSKFRGETGPSGTFMNTGRNERDLSHINGVGTY